MTARDGYGAHRRAMHGELDRGGHLKKSSFTSFISSSDSVNSIALPNAANPAFSLLHFVKANDHGSFHCST